MTQETTTLDELVAAGDFDTINDWLADHGALDIADELPRMEPADQAVLFRLLPKNRALALLEALDPIRQQQVLDALGDDSVHELFAHLDTDNRGRSTNFPRRSHAGCWPTCPRLPATTPTCCWATPRSRPAGR